jgi:hypothetical protein
MLPSYFTYLPLERFYLFFKIKKAQRKDNLHTLPISAFCLFH